MDVPYKGDTDLPTQAPGECELGFPFLFAQLQSGGSVTLLWLPGVQVEHVLLLAFHRWLLDVLDLSRELLL